MFGMMSGILGITMNKQKEKQELELAWAAGFFDGEGSTCVERKVNRLILSVGQNNPIPLQRFVDVVGFGLKVYGPHKDGGYKVTTSSKKALAVAIKLWPYLSDIKRQQIIRSVGTVYVL